MKTPHLLFWILVFSCQCIGCMEQSRYPITIASFKATVAQTITYKRQIDILENMANRMDGSENPTKEGNSYLAKGFISFKQAYPQFQSCGIDDSVLFLAFKEVLLSPPLY